MIRDLIGAGNQTAEADVLVVGAGTVGLVVAANLAKKGLRVVVLESGGLRQDEDEHPLNKVIHLKSQYAGAAHGRFRCLGGTSTRWGGALIPVMSEDMDPAVWPISHAEIVKFLPAVENLFGLPGGPYDFADIPDPSIESHLGRMAKWPPLPRRNVANLLSSSIHDPLGPVIWLNATATDFEVSGSRLRAVTAQSPRNGAIRVCPKEVVFAAGAIESTRLLLLMDHQNSDGLFAPDDQLGRFFHDHLSVVVGNLDVHDRKAFYRLLGFRFEAGGVMRNLRLELSGNTALREQIRPCFAHIGFKESPESGFNALRDFLSFLQQRRIPNFSILRRLMLSTPLLARVGWWRYIEKRLLFPPDAAIQVHMVLEQAPRFESRITLSDAEMDQYGQPLAVIDWSVDEQDIENLRKATDAIQDTWASSNLAKIASFVRRVPSEAEAELARGGGIYHPGGATRMGRSPESGVVDQNLRLFRVPNVTVMSTSVLPTGGGANPTMTLLMLAFRCLDGIERKVTSP